MKHHIHLRLSDDEMNELANAFHSCDKEVEVSIPKTHYVIHLERDDDE